jgi:hypothetical protein
MRRIFTMALMLAMPVLAFAEPSVSVSAASAAGDLPMDGLGAASTHVVKIADVSLSTASSGGLTVSITSGQLANADGRTSVSFRVLLVNDGASAPSPSAFTTPSGDLYSVPTSSAGSVEKDLYIRYTPAALQDPGTYSATVNLSVVDN